MAGIFINYRGEDSQIGAALIDRELAARFGDDQVFFDCRSLPAGSDFVAELLGRLRVCSMLLVVIGPRWLTVTDDAGGRRIDNPRDWIRREIVEAFARGLRVVPVLLDEARLPTEADLPADIAALSSRQFVPLRRRYTKIDLAFLVESIEEDPEYVGLAATRSVQGRPVPQQLPAAPRMFAGRHHELAQMTAVLEGNAGASSAVLISAIAGAGGIGKTWLALHWAHQHRDRFLDGQLFVDLRGFTPAGKPMTPDAALRGLLDAFGIEPARIPVDLDARVGLYRSLSAGKRMLIVLDNARDSTQVIPLLPGSPTCTVIVTSRDQLTGLVTAHGAHLLTLDVLDQHDTRDLLDHRLGRTRLEAEPHAVGELMAYCGGLPLALGIVAGRATAHPSFPLATLATELRDVVTRLGALDTGDPAASLSAALSWSYTALDAEQAAVFGLLGLAPGPDIGPPAAANLTGLPITQVGAVLRSLERVSLIQQHQPGRWRMHELIRLYAGNQAHHDQSEERREATLRRLVDHYIHTALAGDRLLSPYRKPIELGPPASGCHPHVPTDRPAALAWLDTEHPCLLATQHLAIERVWHPSVRQLAWTLNTFHRRRGRLHDNLSVWRHALRAAHRLGDPAIQILVHRLLRHACAGVRRDAEALGHLHQALTLAEDAGDALAKAHAHCEAALGLCRRHHDRAGESDTLDSLGYIAHHTGMHTTALAHYQQALRLYDAQHRSDDAERVRQQLDASPGAPCYGPPRFA